MSESVLQTAELCGDCISFTWTDGFEAKFAVAWLLDNAPTGAPIGGQRIRSIESLAASGPVNSAVVIDDAVHLTYARERLTWSGASLREHAAGNREARVESVLWHCGIELSARPAVPYDHYLMDDEVLRAALLEVARFGLVRLKDAGTGPDEVARAVARFGFIRETNYGRIFEVRVAADPVNVADTARALEPHTDNPYREPVPTLQLLHCLSDAGEGGATYVLDGFALAHWLKESHAHDFERLAENPVPFVFTTASGERYEARTPILHLGPNGELVGIRLNHRALGSVNFDATTTAEWYRAYLIFATEACAPLRRFSFRLEPGDIVMFDNERILHGRDAFSGASDRHLKGCYADRDGLLATLARLGD
jgi:gamma-butyrobetaine dioxygenase